jgi:hypothetical protein
MSAWSDRRAYLRKQGISALYPLSRLWFFGTYEQPELWVSDFLKTCYVVNPKVACSSIQVALTEAATGQQVREFRHNHPLVLSFRRTEFRHVPGGYFCFTLVRHPFQRVISFYKDKFLRPRLEGRPFEYASYLGGVFRSSDGFEAVCHAIARIPDRLADRHFVSQAFWFDRICRARLDYIGHLETLDADWSAICARIGRPIGLPRLNSSAALEFSPSVPEGLKLRYVQDFDRFSYVP